MKILLLLIFIILTNCSFSQYGDTSFKIASTAILINSKFGSGSGVVYRDTNQIYYLITANHVLFTDKMTLLSDSIDMIYYIGNPNYSPRDTLKLSLKSALNKRQLIGDVMNDIAVLKFTKLDSSKKYAEIQPFGISSTNNPPVVFTYYQQKDIHQVEPSSDILMFGYPKSLDFGNNYDFNKPLLRKGIVAGVDVVNNKIIIDCFSFWGNSGGPIIQYDMATGKPYVIGIVSQFVPFTDILFDKFSNARSVNAVNSGYTVVVPIEMAFRLIKQIPWL